jgi:hypothetical protein
MRTLVGTALLLAMTGVVVAADFPSNNYYAAPPPLAYSWAGPYIGANLGYEWGTINNNPTRPSGIAGGAQAGFNWQQGAFVTAEKRIFNCPLPKTRPCRGSFPITGSAPCAAALASASIISSSTERRVWPTGV